MSSSKDKRTKEQILRLLDNALTQEELLADKIKALETELADCRKKAEDPRMELTEEALSGSKVSFRIDYYRTEKSGPLKGIIEHLPSREPKPFEGEGWETMQHFIGRYLSEESVRIGKKKAISKKEATPETVIASQPVVSSEKPVFAPPTEEESSSRIAERLRAEFAAQIQRDSKPLAKIQIVPLPQLQKSVQIQQRPSAAPTAQKPMTQMQQPIRAHENKAMPQRPESRLGLLERLREEQRQRFKSR